MPLLKILATLAVSGLLLYKFIPKGFFLFELLRLPGWLLKLRSLPRSGYRVEKYAYGKHFRQYLLFYQPEKGTPTKKHVIVYFHGGGWQFGRPEMFRPNAQVLVEKGYCVFMPSHRRIPFFDIKKQREDVANALKKAVEIMRAEGLQEHKILLGGMSSGANLAGLLVFDRSLCETVGLSRHLLAGAFLFGGPINLEGMWHSPPLWFLTGRRGGSKFQLANPASYLQQGDDLPILLLHTEKDGLVEPRSVESFFEKTRTLGMPNVELHMLPDMVHNDAASWCFAGHPSHRVVMDWLEKMEKPTPAELAGA